MVQVALQRHSISRQASCCSISHIKDIWLANIEWLTVDERAACRISMSSDTSAQTLPPASGVRPTCSCKANRPLFTVDHCSTEDAAVHISGI